MEYRDFDNIKILTRIEGELINETPLRVGTGREPPLGASVDLAIYRVNGVPCIPGSSLKGVLRSLAESLVRSREVYVVHSPWDKEAIENEAKSSKFCPICGIFGSTELASHVKIYDAYPKDQAARTFIKPGISIDREFGAVKPGALFTEEYVMPNVTWSFKMDVLNIRFLPEPDEEDPRATLLNELFNYIIELGLNIGARKGVGSGFVKLKNVRWSAYSFKDGKLSIVSRGVPK